VLKVNPAFQIVISPIQNSRSHRLNLGRFTSRLNTLSTCLNLLRTTGVITRPDRCGAHHCRTIAVFGWKTAEKYEDLECKLLKLFRGRVRRETLNQKVRGSIPLRPIDFKNKRLQLYIGITFWPPRKTLCWFVCCFLPTDFYSISKSNSRFSDVG
jgi:hypothetical protein